MFLKSAEFQGYWDEEKGDEGGAGGGGLLDSLMDGPGDGDGDKSGEGEGAAAAAAGASGDGVARPEWLTEDKFWDPENGVKQDLLFQNYRELVTKQSQGKLEGDVPETVDGYELDLPENYPNREAVLEGLGEDPIAQWFRDTCHELKLPTNIASTLWNGYMERALEQMPEPFSAEKEIESLGPQGAAIVEHLAKTGEQWKSIGLFNEADIRAFALAAHNADGARMMSKVINHLEGNAQIPAKLPVSGAMSRQELESKRWLTIEDGPQKGQYRYDTDLAFRAEVDQDYEKMYGTEPAGTSVPLGVAMQD